MGLIVALISMIIVILMLRYASDGVIVLIFLTFLVIAYLIVGKTHNLETDELIVYAISGAMAAIVSFPIFPYSHFTKSISKKSNNKLNNKVESLEERLNIIENSLKSMPIYNKDIVQSSTNKF